MNFTLWRDTGAGTLCVCVLSQLNTAILFLLLGMQYVVAYAYLIPRRTGAVCPCFLWNAFAILSKSNANITMIIYCSVCTHAFKNSSNITNQSPNCFITTLQKTRLHISILFKLFFLASFQDIHYKVSKSLYLLLMHNAWSYCTIYLNMLFKRLS